METINLILLILIIAVIVKIVLCSDTVHRTDSEKLAIVPKRIIPQYCSNCGDLNTATCSTCSNCGVCVTDGVAKCVDGDVNGPYFRQDCDSWNPQSYVYNFGLPTYVNYNYTYDLPRHRRNFNYRRGGHGPPRRH